MLAQPAICRMSKSMQSSSLLFPMTTSLSLPTPPQSVLTCLMLTRTLTIAAEWFMGKRPGLI